MSEPTELKTPNGTVVVLKSFLSGGDSEDINRVMLENMTFKVDSTSGEIDKAAQEISATITQDRTKKAIELLVVSVNGATDNVYQAVRELPVEDYNLVVEKVNELAAPLAPTPSKE